MTTFFVGSSGQYQWIKTSAKTLNGAKAIASKTFAKSTEGELFVGELVASEQRIEQVAVKHGSDNWTQA